MRTQADHPTAAKQFLSDPQQVESHDSALWGVRKRRDAAAAMVPEWEVLRETAQAIKADMLAHIDTHLEDFARAAEAAGAIVHWAPHADDLNQTVHGILNDHHVKRVVKSKSMLTEECGLNDYLHDQGMEVVDTDLGERLVQLRDEPPSHIVLPAVHLQLDEIADIFRESVEGEITDHSPAYLTEVARQDLRPRYTHAEAGITGVNFAIAETGTLVVCTNEGNADLGTTLPKLHIACMGLEKLLPTFEDLGVFTRILARSATGQAITSYTSHFTGPIEGGTLHIVIVDNGRSKMIHDEHHASSLACIRCGACMNTCPVFRHSGGHSYAYTIPGPIGSILGAFHEPDTAHSLPSACSLCGSCTAVCPVKIDLHDQLLHARDTLLKQGHESVVKKVGLNTFAFVASRPKLYAFATKLASYGAQCTPTFIQRLFIPGWAKYRAVPTLAPKSFRDHMKDRHDER